MRKYEIMVRESEYGAYLGAGAGLAAVATPVAITPNFDVFDAPGLRLLLGKCSRLADDEEPEAGRFGIDFHRALPSFDGQGEGVCDWGAGPIAVNASNYAKYLPCTLKFREFTATLAFAARTYEEFRIKSQVYENFYRHLYHAPAPLIVAAPHAGDVQRPADSWHPYPKTEIDAWTARVASHLLGRPYTGEKRLLISLHSTDYLGSLLDIGDFGLPQNNSLTAVVENLNQRYRPALMELLPAYREHIMPYTTARLKYFVNRWGTLEPERLKRRSSAVRFEILNLTRIMNHSQELTDLYTLPGMLQGLERFWQKPPPLITLNGIFSGRKTARLLKLAEKLQQYGIYTAVQLEVSRFLASRHPQLAADLIKTLLNELKPETQQPEI